MADDVTLPDGREPQSPESEAIAVSDTPEPPTADAPPSDDAAAAESETSSSSADPSEAGWVAAPPVVDSAADDQLSEESAIAEMRGELTQRLDELQKAITRATALQEHHAAMVQKLHAENQSLRQGELSQAMKPFLLDVARLHDDIERLIQSAGDELAKAAPIPEFILDVLDRHGVTQVRPSAGDQFDSKIHQGLKVTPTSDQSLDGKVQSVIRPGFVGDGERVVRPAQVVVYRYAAEARPPAPPQPQRVADGAPAGSAVLATPQLDQTRSDDGG